MGCSISCATFEKFSSFLEWEIRQRSGSQSIDHYLDDFIFMVLSKARCKGIMNQFSLLCKKVSIPVAHEKTVGPVNCLIYLGYELDSIAMEIRIPKNKIEDILAQIITVL